MGDKRNTRACWRILTLFAVVALPAGKAVLVTLRAARVVAEFVIARAAECGAGGVVVVGLAGDTHAVRERGSGAGVPQRVPLRARLYDARPPRLLDQARLLCTRHTKHSALHKHFFCNY